MKTKASKSTQAKISIVVAEDKFEGHDFREYLAVHRIYKHKKYFELSINKRLTAEPLTVTLAEKSLVVTQKFVKITVCC